MTALELHLLSRICVADTLDDGIQLRISEHVWNEKCIDCMAGPAPPLWQQDKSLWIDPPGACEMPMGLDCCTPTSKLFEAYGMLDDGTLPFRMSQSMCCATVCGGYVLQSAGLPILPYYMTKLRAKVGDDLGIPRASFPLDFLQAFATGPYIFAIQRELIVRGKCARTKPAPATVANEVMQRDSGPLMGALPASARESANNAHNL